MSLHLLKRPSVLFFFFSILFCTVRFLWTLKALVWVGLRQCDVWRFNSAFPQQSPPVQTLQSTNSPLGLSSVSTCLNVTRTQCHLISPPLPPQASSVKVPNCTRGGRGGALWSQRGLCFTSVRTVLDWEMLAAKPDCKHWPDDFRAHL